MDIYYMLIQWFIHAPLSEVMSIGCFIGCIIVLPFIGD